MKKIRKIIPLLCILGLSAYSQDIHSPFTGVVSIGTGISTVFDFQSGNNGASIPLEIGIEALKYVTSKSNIQIGFSFSTRGSRYYEKIDNGGIVSKSWYRLSLRYLDLKVSYNREIGTLKGMDTYFFVGLNNSYLLQQPTYSDLFEFEVSDFRDYNISGFIGARIMTSRRSSISCKINQSIISVLDKSYSIVLPIELLISFSFRLL